MSIPKEKVPCVLCECLLQSCNVYMCVLCVNIICTVHVKETLTCHNLNTVLPQNYSNYNLTVISPDDMSSLQENYDRLEQK